MSFPDVISGVVLPAGEILDGTSGEIAPETWKQAQTQADNGSRVIDIAWYEEQRVRLRAHQAQAASINESLAHAWYKVIKRSLSDLPIQKGGRSLMNPEYGANMHAIATALGLSPRTLSNYRSAVSRVRNDEHFRDIAKDNTWANIVFSLGAGPLRRLKEAASGGPGLPLVKRRLVIQVPTQTTDFLMQNGLEASEITAIIVAHLRQPKVQRELLKLKRLASREIDHLIESSTT